MSLTVSQSPQTRQLHLVNIVSFSQDKLTTNFSRILSRLNRHQEVTERNSDLINEVSEKINYLTNTIQLKFDEERQKYQNSAQIELAQISKMKQMMLEMSDKIIKNSNTLAEVLKTQDSLKNTGHEESLMRNTQIESMKERLRSVDQQIQLLGNSVSKKQSINQVHILRQSIDETNKQCKKMQDEQKFVQFKLEKFELLAQKNEKSQMTKEISLMKQLQQKIKTEFKTNAGSIQRVPFVSLHQFNNENTQKAITKKKIETESEILHLQNIGRSESNDMTIFQYPQGSKSAFADERKQSNTFTFQNNSLPQKLFNNMNDNMSLFERKFEHIQTQIKQITEFIEGRERNKKSNKSELEQKLNTIKPELIKLWTKSDTFEDKISFLERKLEQKSKQITYILEALKESQSSRFDQKLKILQTEMYANIKQIKTKIETKVATNDFEKFSKAVIDRMDNMNDQILLKSDKIQVKKALLFLESKIKEIILVISEDEQNEKDALLTKKQVKCISCDKDIDKFSGTVSNIKGNWDAFPSKEHSPQVLGRFGITNFGSLARKLKRLDNKDIPVLIGKKNKQSLHSDSKHQSR